MTGGNGPAANVRPRQFVALLVLAAEAEDKAVGTITGGAPDDLLPEVRGGNLEGLRLLLRDGVASDGEQEHASEHGAAGIGVHDGSSQGGLGEEERREAADGSPALGNDGLLLRDRLAFLEPGLVVGDAADAAAEVVDDPVRRLG
jgi:hypothetical protein